MTDQPLEGDRKARPGGQAPGQDDATLNPGEHNPAQKPGAPATGGDGAKGAGGPEGFGAAD